MNEQHGGQRGNGSLRFAGWEEPSQGLNLQRVRDVGGIRRNPLARTIDSCQDTFFFCPFKPSYKLKVFRWVPEKVLKRLYIGNS